MDTITVTLKDRISRCPVYTEVGSLLPEVGENGLPVLGALVNHDVVSLTYPIPCDSAVEPLTAANPHGWRIYEQSVCFLLGMAIRDVYPKATYSIDYSMGPGLYCSFSPGNGDPDSGEIRPEHLDAIRRRMVEFVEARLPIGRRKLGFSEVVRCLEEAKLEDKLSLLKYRNPPHITIHVCGRFSDITYGAMAPHTGVLRHFALEPYPPGFVLQLPEPDRPDAVPAFQPQPHLFQVFREHKEWGRILGLNTVGRLNDVIHTGEIGSFIRISEALHEKKVARIADAIAARRGEVHIVLVAGPSSAGKTTFAKRLAVQLTVNGLRPIMISLDDYFREHDQTPRDESGQLDFEHIEALDVELFNQQLLALAAGEEVEIPFFNFATKLREYRGTKLRMGDGRILIIEGIHGLNPRLTHMIPDRMKFRVYISALTQLSLDSGNRISTTDNRLIRRMVRDHRYRGNTALKTLGMWPSVRRGERRWVFPFQQFADAVFNSALDYELAVLKPLVEPLLMQVKPSDPEYAQARRLTGFLMHFLEVPDQEVPPTSILREYIGRSSFTY